ncbi:hypothetical protein RZN05_07530 [Sphingomonas sp. HF-S4]|uniref:Uncharacterized protein n=1 Tax=Sphingomonas agrestis TaxID=3080540 RepID=A0ABU3Y611_9SPHN|nr:hypothetical protein [Sphingomonas sp. HF-S4]MDV3456828.1 hypothetical protein [Sphingomonas sp. HF-S4]
MNETVEPNVSAPPPGSTLFVFQEIENPGGGESRRIGFTEVDIAPRSYEELASAKLHQAISIPLEMYNGRILETNIEGIDVSKYANLKAKLESPFTAKAIGLVRGGWLPSGLAASRSNSVVLPDRNIVSEIVGRFDDGKKTGRDPDFLDLFENSQVQINPMLFPLEGNGRSLPDATLATSQLEEAVIKLGKALPTATLMVGPESLKGLLGLIEDIRPIMMREQAFLRRVAPMLANQIARNKVDARWDEVLEAARETGVPMDSLAVIAALSTVANSGACPARKLLKFHAAYTDADAYNALSDLNTLKVLIYCFALAPDLNTQLCTGDRNLALFWVGLRASDMAWDGTMMSASFTPNAAILPEPYNERWVAALG